MTTESAVPADAAAPAAAGDVRIGTAGWSIPAPWRAHFGDGDSVLARYATRLDCVEIDSSFYRPHQRQTYARWAASVPPSFRFAVKLPRTVTQYARLRDTEPLLDAFAAQVGGLGESLGVLLVQLPPSLAFDEPVATAFARALRSRWPRQPIAFEPRHASWQHATALWQAFGLSRVAADPPRFDADVRPAGVAPGYVRWHGSPRIYRDRYGPQRLRAMLQALDPQAAGRPAMPLWIILDNTAEGHALDDAFALRAIVDGTVPDVAD